MLQESPYHGAMSAASSSRASAAQPGASSRKRSLSQLSLAEETAEQTATPLYDRLLLNLEMCGSRGQELLAYITQSCVFDDLLQWADVSVILTDGRCRSQ